MDIEHWIRQAQQGDATAFNRLVSHYQATLFHVAYHTSGNTDDALDACQEACLSAWRAVARFDGGPEQFRAWLVRIVINACHDLHRHRARRPQVPIEQEIEGEVVALPLPDPGESPEQYAERADLRRLLESALAELPEDLRTILVLQQLGMDYPELAEVLGIPLGTVKSRLFRARERMRALLLGADLRQAPAEPAAGDRRSGEAGPDAVASTVPPPGEEATTDAP
jgi:RNA polymerase sigma-70 factor (ECF subfamily)